MTFEIVVTPMDGGSTRRFAKDCVELGRVPAVDVCLPEHGSLLSRHHAAVFLEDGDLYVKDMGSRSGTFLNGERVREPVNILPEDAVQLGKGGPSFHFELVRRARAAELPTPSKKVKAAEQPKDETEAFQRPASDVVKRGARKRLMGNSTLAVALDAVVARERARSNKIVSLSVGSSALTVVLVLIAAVALHGRSVSSLEAAHASELEKVKADEKTLDERIAALTGQIAGKDSELETAKGRGELALKLEKQVADLKRELAAQKALLDEKRKSEAIAALAGHFEITTFENGAPATGSVVLYTSGWLARQVSYPDGTIHTRSGKATLSGSTLDVTFEGSGDPRDLTGEWRVSGAAVSGRYSGMATFERAAETWSASFQTVSTTERSGGGESVQLWGTLTDKTFAAERLVVGAKSLSVGYALSPDGFKLSASFGGTSEELTRRRLPADGKGTRATYTIAGASLTGTLASGEKDAGTRARRSEETAKSGVEKDPVPAVLSALKDGTRIFEKAREDSHVFVTVDKGCQITVVGSENQCFRIELKRKTGETQPYYVLQSDVEPSHARYKKLTGPLFKGPPTMSGAEQLHLGICYLLSALMSIARTQPEAIREMIVDEGETVKVRFFERDRANQPVEHWFRLNKSVIVDDHGSPLYVENTDGQMWCPIIVKAYAHVHGGGHYGGIDGGNQGDMYDRILGRSPERTPLWVPLPAEISDTFLKKLAVSPADIKVLGASERGKAYAAEKEFLLANPGASASLEHLDRVLGALVAAGLTEAGRAKLHEYYKTRCQGPLGTGIYSTFAKAVHKHIRESLDKRMPVGLGTKSWGHGGTGQSGGENTDVVPGIADHHAYAVLDTSEHDGLLWVKVANPWHLYSRRYVHAGDAWTATGTSRDPSHRTPDDDGEFEVELSDVMRYFSVLEVAN